MKDPTPGDALLAAWRTNDRVTRFLVESLPPELWPKSIPGAPRRTIRMIAGHLHNARCMWIEAIARGRSTAVPARVDRRSVGRAELLRALARSNRGVERIVELGLERGGRLPGRPAWSSFAADVVHLVSYLIAHEAHHRGQICLVARQLGQRLPTDVTSGLWQWTKRAREADVDQRASP